jgi:hypothetical protein
MNQRTHQLMAMKQIERKDQRELLSLIDEVKNLTGIHHPNLVRYFGYEVHRVRDYDLKVFTIEIILGRTAYIYGIL